MKQQYGQDRIDDVLHSSRLRLAVMGVLTQVESASFVFLRDVTKSTDAHMLLQLRKLEQAGYIARSKGKAEGHRVTDYSITPKGRRAVISYVEHLQIILKWSPRAGDRS
jgi:DNA-binding MarR family transcriptional regulator